MKLRYLFVPTILAAGLFNSLQAQQVITFDELTDSPSGLQIGNGYAGLTWNNFWELDGETVDSYYGIAASGYANGVISPNNVAYNYNGAVASISSATPINVLSGYFTGAFNDDLHILIEGYNGATLLYRSIYLVNAEGPSLLSLNMDNVTEVTFDSYAGYNANLNYGSGSQFVLDNLTVSAVPEPPVWILLPAAGLLLGLASKRQNSGGHWVG